jgi:hypothetical protein
MRLLAGMGLQLTIFWLKIARPNRSRFVIETGLAKLLSATTQPLTVNMIGARRWLPAM